MLIADSIFRTGTLYHGYHETVEHHCEVPVEVNLDLWSTSIVIAKSHKLRVTVSSSNYPRFEKNNNHGSLVKNGVKSIVAHNKLHTGKKYPSRIILPVVRGKITF